MLNIVDTIYNLKINNIILLLNNMNTYYDKQLAEIISNDLDNNENNNTI